MIEEIIKEFEERFGIEYPFDNPLTHSNQIKSFLRDSHLKYLQGKRKELEGEMRPTNSAFSDGTNEEIEFLVRKGDIGIMAQHYRNVGYNLAKQEEIDKINNEIKETEKMI